MWPPWQGPNSADGGDQFALRRVVVAHLHHARDAGTRLQRRCQPVRWLALFAIACCASWCCSASFAIAPRSTRRTACAAEPAKTAALAEEAVAGVTRVVTYNVLHPPLCHARRFPHCKEEDLGEAVRWERVAQKLESVMSVQPATVICLQEVSESWAGRLHAFFQQRDWHFAYALTPLTYWQPMGVALAWPNSALEVENVSIHHVGSEVSVPRSVRTSWPWRLLRTFTWGRLGRTPKELEPWRLASRKQNRLLAARLRDRETGVTFTAATYHMPCLFDDPPLMQAKCIHAAILRSALKRFANGTQIVLGVDLNTKPQDSEFEVMQTGHIDPQDLSYPKPAAGQKLDKWRSEAFTLRSAYSDAMGREPDFTNYAWIENQEAPFRETIDYVFVSDGVKVIGVRPLPPAVEGDPVYPSAEEPSDHLMLAADLRFSPAVDHSQAA